MNLQIQEQMLADAQKDLETQTFGHALSSCRNALRLSCISVEDLTEIPFHRIRMWERDKFSNMPNRWEIERLCILFSLPYDIMSKKALDHCQVKLERKRSR